MKRIPTGERELFESEFVWMATRLLKQGLTIPEARQYLKHLDVI